MHPSGQKLRISWNRMDIISCCTECDPCVLACAVQRKSSLLTTYGRNPVIVEMILVDRPCAIRAPLARRQYMTEVMQLTQLTLIRYAQANTEESHSVQQEMMSILFHEVRSFWPEGCISDSRLKEVDY